MNQTKLSSDVLEKIVHDFHHLFCILLKPPLIQDETPFIVSSFWEHWNLDIYGARQLSAGRPSLDRWRYEPGTHCPNLMHYSRVKGLPCRKGQPGSGTQSDRAGSWIRYAKAAVIVDIEQIHNHSSVASLMKMHHDALGPINCPLKTMDLNI